MVGEPGLRYTEDRDDAVLAVDTHLVDEAAHGSLAYGIGSGLGGFAKLRSQLVERCLVQGIGDGVPTGYAYVPPRVS